MKELICPKCGTIFKVDETDYKSIIDQVRNNEFEKELEVRMNELLLRQKAEQKLEIQKTEMSFMAKLNEKDKALKDMAVEISKLKDNLKNVDAKNKNEILLVLAEKDKAIARLNSVIEQNEAKIKIAVMEEQSKFQKTLEDKNAELVKLKSEAELEKTKAKVHEAELKKQHENELRAKQEQIDYYKDMKMKLSTKMVGETLEKHCSNLFNTMLRPIMENAYFEKDNDVSDGTKGDFIFRDYDSGTEYVSIMFEMKNETDTHSTKHKNEDFLKKLDEDRRKKNCEFAVLVSLLEPDSELYNNGIVDVSHHYEKMYVIRPQFFIPLITLLVQTSRKSLEYKRQLIEARNKEVDVTNFESKLENFKAKFGRHYELASRKFSAAIEDIDATIKKLQKVREELVSSENNIRLANQDTEDLTIRKLTYKNPTMKQKFDEARVDCRTVV